MNNQPLLRPMTISDLFDATFRLYRAHFVTFIGIAALTQVPLLIISLLVQFGLGGQATADVLHLSSQPPRLLPGQSFQDVLPINSLIIFYGLTYALGGLQFLIRQSLVAGALANAIARVYRGEATSVLDAYRFGWRSFVSLLAIAGILLMLMLLLGTVVIACPFGVIFVSYFRDATTTQPNGVFTALAALALLFVGLIGFVLVILVVYTRFLFSTQAVVLEQRGPLDGLRRSWGLVRGSFWRTLGMLVLMGGLAYLISFTPALMLSFTLSFINRSNIQDLVLNQIVTTIVAQLGLIIALPLQYGLYTLLYYDLRVRKEGYDIELRSQQLTAT